MKFLGVLLEYPGVGNEDVDTCIITEVLYSDAKNQWHVKSDHATKVEGDDRNYFASEYEGVVDIVISRGRGRSNPGLGNHITAYNNNFSCPDIAMEDIATICAAPTVVGGGGGRCTCLWI